MIPKSSPKGDAGLADDFRPFEFEGSAKVENFEHAEVIPMASEAFGLPGHFWEWIQGDEELHAAFRRMIEAKAQELSQAGLEEARREAMVAAKSEGIEIGIKQSKANVGTLIERLEGLIAQVREEKLRLLEHHADLWVRLLQKSTESLFRRLPQAQVEEVKRFFQEAIQQFQMEGALEITCAPNLHHELSLLELEGKKVSWKADPTLAENDFRIEWGGGQIVYDEARAEKRLKEILER